MSGMLGKEDKGDMHMVLVKEGGILTNNKKETFSFKGKWANA